MWHQKTADKRMPDTDNKRSYKSLLIRYGTIFQGLQEHNTFNVGVLGSSPRRITENKRKIKQIPDNQTLSGIFIFPKYCISPQKTVMITGEIGGLDIYLKKSTELDHISLIFRILRGSKPTRKN